MKYAINQFDMVDDYVACNLETDYSISLKIALAFLSDQLKSLISRKDHRRYNILTQVLT